MGRSPLPLAKYITADRVGTQIRCEICDTSWFQRKNMQSHVQSVKHRQRLRVMERPPAPEPMVPPVDSPVLTQMELPSSSFVAETLPLNSTFEASQYEPEKPDFVANEIDWDPIEFYESGVVDQGHVEEDNSNPNLSILTESGWFPYESKGLALLDITDCMARQKYSNSQISVNAIMMEASGVINVPRLSAFRAKQQHLRDLYSMRPTNINPGTPDSFWANDIRTIIANDWASPHTRRNLKLYPDKDPVVMSEIWHGDKWLTDIPPHLQQPMWLDDMGKQYWVGELCANQVGEVYKIVRWWEIDRDVYAEVFRLTQDNETVAPSIDEDDLDFIKATTLTHNHADLCTIDGFEGSELGSLHADRDEENTPLYICYVEIFGDDVSGNTTKQWNKHWNLYVSNRNIPRQALSHEFHVHFLSTHQENEPFKAYDGINKTVIRLKLCLLSFAGDNPMASELCNHMGGRANRSCRKCIVGGTQKEKKSSLFHTFFEAGQRRSRDFVKDTLVEEGLMSALGEPKIRLNALQTDTGIKTYFSPATLQHMVERLSELSKEQPDMDREGMKKWLRDHGEEFFPLFAHPDEFDCVVDTPTELLHAVLLGLVKYVWYDTMNLLSKSTAKTERLARRFNEVGRDGMNIECQRGKYIIDHYRSLNGKGYRQVIQLCPFILRGLVETSLMKLWLDTARLTALLFMPVIFDKPQYISNVDAAVATVLDDISNRNPYRIINKTKLHLLTHATDDVQRFGPLVGITTERYEGFNSVFRSSSIYSNRHNPSRDIANDQAGIEWLKHLIADGYLQDPKTGRWRQAGHHLREFLHKAPIRRACSYDPESMYSSNKPLREGRVGMTEHPVAASNWDAVKHQFSERIVMLDRVRSSNGDTCKVGSFVFVKTGDDQSLPARILGILSPKRGDAMVLIEGWTLLGEIDESTTLPVITASGEEPLIIASTSIYFLFNAQPMMGSERMVINLFSFRNIHLLYATLPSSLTTVKPPTNEEREASYNKGISHMARSKARVDEQPDYESDGGTPGPIGHQEPLIHGSPLRRALNTQ